MSSKSLRDQLTISGGLQRYKTLVSSHVNPVPPLQRLHGLWESFDTRIIYKSHRVFGVQEQQTGWRTADVHSKTPGIISHLGTANESTITLYPQELFCQPECPVLEKKAPTSVKASNEFKHDCLCIQCGFNMNGFFFPPQILIFSENCHFLHI